MSTALQELLRMPVQDRVEAMNTLWDSLNGWRDEFVLSEEERDELDRRLDDAEGNPGEGCSWEELKSRLTSR